MASKLGDLIRQARLRQGLDQAELSRRLEVSQQTISRWERGKTRPEEAQLRHLANALHLSLDDLMDVGGYGRPQFGQSEPMQPVRPRVTTLPLEQLSSEDFEQFSADLARALYPNATDVHRYGAQGHAQAGIDVIVHPPSGHPVGIQCKRHAEYGPAKVRAAVKALTLDLSDCYIFLTRVATPDARAEVAKHRNWHLWDKEDLSRAVRMLPDRDAAIRIVDTYFPGWREPFLGVAAPGPWLTTDEFFRPRLGSGLYSQEWELVGRSTELLEICEFVTNGDEQVALLLGRGGLGKTRLLREIALKLERDHAAKVRFLDRTTTLESAQFEVLPPDDHLVVMLDDAHEWPEIGRIIAGVTRARPRAKIILSMRPYGQSRLSADLRHLDIRITELPTWTLGDLKRQEAEALACEILELPVEAPLAQRLALAAPDCPLLIVVGATLIKRGQLAPDLVESSDVIRSEIMNRLQEAIVVDPAVADPELRREVLRAVAALQPVRTNTPDFRSALTRITGKAYDQVVPHLRNLEEAGVLLRRGDSLRVVPDLLGDAILIGAAVDGPNAISTGYLERAFVAADGQPLQHLLVNACRIDWHIRKSSNADHLIELLWGNFVDEFQCGGVRTRLALLKVLGQVAFFQPARTMSLIQWAIDNPATAVEEDDHLIGSVYAPSYIDVLREIPELLERISYNLDYLREALDLLWRLAQDDNRPPHQNPNHPIRILTELAQFGPGKPILIQQKVVEAASRWLERTECAESVYSPFEVMTPILATETEVRRSDGVTITLSRRSVVVEAVRDLRNSVLELAYREACAADLRRAVAAVRAIDAATTYPRGGYGSVPSEEEREAWTPLFLVIIDRVARLLREEALDPVVQVAIRRLLIRHSRYSKTSTALAAQEILGHLPTPVEVNLAQALQSGWDFDLHRGDPEDIEQQRQERLNQIATAVISEWSAEEAVEIIELRLDANRRAFAPNGSQPAPFIWALVRNAPRVGSVICRRVVENPTSPLREITALALSVLADTNPSVALPLAHELFATQDLQVQRQVAHAFGWGRANRRSLLEGEEGLLRALLNHPDLIVRQSLTGAAWSLATLHRTFAIELVLSMNLTDSPTAAEEVAELFGPGRLSWDELTAGQAAALLQQFRECPEIEGFHISRLLSEMSRNQPEMVLDFLKGRIELEEQEPPRRAYRSMPYSWHHPLFIRDSERFVEHLKSIIRWMADREDRSWVRRREGAELFVIVAREFDAEVLRTLTNTLEIGRPEDIKAVGFILQKVPDVLLWTNVPFVAKALQLAKAHGDECVQAIGGGLHVAVSTGGRVGTPGQPFPQDVEQRDRSLEIARTLPYGSTEQQFYRSLHDSAVRRISWEEELDRGLEDGRTW
ncbi:helix-turn-helix domain-containing protein [Microbispora rosea]